MEVHVGLARDVRRDEHARVVPQAAVGVAFEFPAIDVERGPTDLAIGQPLLQRGLVDDLSPGHVDHHRTGLHRGDRRAIDQAFRLCRQLAADSDEVALAQQRVQTVGGFQPAHAFRRGLAGGDPPARSHHAHPHGLAQPRHVAPDPSQADDADRLAAEQPGPVGPVLELVPRPVRSRAVKALDEVQDRREHVLRHGERVPQTSRRRHRDVASPQIAVAQIARPRRELVKPTKTRGPRAKVLRKRERPQCHLGRGQQAIPFCLRQGLARPGLRRQVSAGRGWWPRPPVLRLEHLAPIHDADGRIHGLHRVQRRIRDGRDDEDLDGAVSDHRSAAKEWPMGSGCRCRSSFDTSRDASVA